MAKDDEIISGRYRIIGQIGSGGMSTVYLAMDQSLKKQWAVKEIKRVDDEGQREVINRSLVEEANLIKDLDHPAIPRIVDLISEEGTLYVVMDYIEGQTLRDLCKQHGAHSEKEVVDWGIQLCGVLNYLHRQDPSIVFCDLKPSNVMVKPDGTVMLIDFGIAHHAGRAPQGLSLGTPGYESPEQQEDPVSVDRRSDVYSLGKTLHFLLTLADPTQPALPIRQYRPELSAGLEKVIDKAISPWPQDRYQDCAQFAYALRNYRQEDDAYLDKQRKKWRWFLAALIATLVCLALGLGCLLGENVSRNNNFDYWMSIAKQEPSDSKAEDYFIKASSLRPSSIEPYEGLLGRYRNDHRFTDKEVHQLTDQIQTNEISLRSDRKQWARLTYDTGLLYWYFYSSQDSQDSSASQGSSDSQDSQGKDDDLSRQYERIRYAEQWMKEAASVPDFAQHRSAQIYADIAEFNSQVVSQIAQGTPAGKFRSYFATVKDLVDYVQNDDDEVMRLNVAQFVQDVLRAYPRKFKADGISRIDMVSLADRCLAIARTTSTTSSSTDRIRKTVMDQSGATRQAIDDGFVDAKKVSD